MKIVKYGAEWCGPCREMSKVLKNSGLSYEEVDVDENEELVNQKNINTIPYIEILGDNDEILHTISGLITLDELKKLCRKEKK